MCFVCIEVPAQRGGTPPSSERAAVVARQRGAVRGTRHIRGAGRVLPGVGALPRLQQPRGAHGHHQTANH